MIINVKNDEMLGRTNDKTLHITLIEQQKEIERLNKCYCNRSDCSARINQENEIYDSVVQRIEKAIEYIKDNCITSGAWKDLGFCQFSPIGKIKYKALSSKKVQELLDILVEEDKKGK